MRPTPIERFWKGVNKTATCWLWQKAGRGGMDYGMMKINGQQVYTHRFIWEQTYGPIPLGLWVLHTCDVPRCVNPSHLFLGTWMDNIRDRDRKGRQVTPRGMKNGRAKYPKSLVAALRKDAALGCKKLSEKYGVLKSYASAVCLGQVRRDG